MKSLLKKLDEWLAIVTCGLGWHWWMSEIAHDSIGDEVIRNQCIQCKKIKLIPKL